MKCERCGRNEATFYYQSNINGRVTQVHLCPDCAAELGYTSRLEQSFRPFRRSFFDPFSLLEDFGMLSNRMTEFPAPLEEAARAAAGIPEDTDTPAGLVGRDEAVRLQKERERNALEAQLKNAVDSENYEEAARLRDELKKLSA